MTARCYAEMCGNWTGQGCACQLLDVEPAVEVPVEHRDHDIHGLIISVSPDGSVSVEDDDEDCDCPPDCVGCEIEGVAR